MCPAFALGLVVAESGVVESVTTESSIAESIIALIAVSPADETTSFPDFAGSNENDALEAAGA